MSESLSESVDLKFSEILKTEWDTEISKWDENTKTELDFNKKLAKENKLLMMDSKLLYLTTYDKLEIADLGLFEDDMSTFIAVKHLHNSSSISHLVQQVENSISAIDLEAIAVKVLLEKIAKKKVLFDQGTLKTFVLVIAVDKMKDGIPHVPFFAKLALTNLGNRTVRGVDIKYKFVLKEKYVKAKSS